MNELAKLTDTELQFELNQLRIEKRRLVKLTDEVETNLIGLKLEERRRLEISRADYISSEEPTHLYDDY